VNLDAALLADANDLAQNGWAFGSPLLPGPFLVRISLAVALSSCKPKRLNVTGWQAGGVAGLVFVGGKLAGPAKSRSMGVW